MDTEHTYKLDFINHFKNNGFDISDSTFDLALSRFLDSFDTYKMALFAFQKEVLTSISYLEELNDQTAKGLHILKGGFATFGFMVLSSRANHLETLLKNRPFPTPSDLSEKVSDIKKHVMLLTMPSLAILINMEEKIAFRHRTSLFKQHSMETKFHLLRRNPQALLISNPLSRPQQKKWI